MYLYIYIYLLIFLYICFITTILSTSAHHPPIPPANVLPPGGQIADRHFLRRGVLDDLTAQVGAVDRPQVLLIGLAIGMVLSAVTNQNQTKMAG